MTKTPPNSERGRCIDPTAVTPADVMAYADGEASESVVEHVHACRHCAAEAAGLRRDSRRLTTALYRFECPPPQQLGEYALDVLEPEQRTSIAAHVLACPRCADELQGLRTFLSVEPEPHVSPIERVRRVIAAVLTPRGGTSPAAALRGSGGLADASQAASQTYEAGVIAVSVGMSPAVQPRHVTLVGLVWSLAGDSGFERFAGREARLGPQPAEEPAGTRDQARSAIIDEFGNFVIEDVPPGTYQLEIALEDEIVVVEDVRAVA